MASSINLTAEVTEEMAAEAVIVVLEAVALAVFRQEFSVWVDR